MRHHSILLAPVFVIMVGALLSVNVTANEPTVVKLWPGKAPGETKELPPESDRTKPTDRLIAGRKIIKLGNVSTPDIAIFRPSKEKDTGAAIIICPGGGHTILAYDLEGTEVAEWLTTIGVTGIVLKYRVPAREKEKRYRAAVQDAQRAVSLVRSNAQEWGIDPERIGICGFSAGGETAGLTAVFGNDKTYPSVDAIDNVSCRPDFAVLIYPAYLAGEGVTLKDYIKVDKSTPPMFLAHAGDDRVTPLSSVAMFVELKSAGVPAEMHIYSKGGHGYGLRKTENPVTQWNQHCELWLKASGWLKK